MRIDERQKYILQKASAEGFVSINDMAKALDVSIETVRRDINKLCAQKQLQKTRGGASPVKLNLRKDIDYSARIHHNKKERLAIGMEAASMIPNGSIVALDCGVSIQAIASCLKNISNVTFVTNSLPSACIILEKIEEREIDARLIFVGGEIDTKNRFSKGVKATETVDEFFFDIAFISCTAISVDDVASYSLDEASFSKHIMARSARSVLVAESDKVGKNSFSSFARIGDFDRIIIDDNMDIPSDVEKAIRSSRAELVIVSC